MSSLYQIEKLDNDNYDSWCVQMRSVLVHSGYWKIVNGSLSRESLADAKAKEVWDENNERALASITLCVKPNQLNGIKNCSTSNQAWLRLEETYKPRGPIQKVSLYKRLLNLKMSEGDNVSKHINEFTELAEKLAETGIIIQDELLVIMLLSSLSEEFEHFVVAIETRDNLPALSTVRQKILEEGNRHKEKERDSASTSTNTQHAFTMKTSEGEKTKSRKDVKGKFKGKCFNCGQTGHFANKCRKDKKQPQLLHARQVSNTNAMRQTEWCVDSGATAHMCCSREMFTDFVERDEIISLAGDKQIVAKGKELNMNFISVSRVVEKGLTVTFDSTTATIRRSNGTVVLEAAKRDNLFLARGKTETLFPAGNMDRIWHNRFGHVNFKSLSEMSSKSMVLGMRLNESSNTGQCRTCMLAKIHVAPFPHESETRSENLLDLIHSDVCGPFNVNSIGGSRYFVTFIDDHSRRIFVYFLKAKSEVLEKFKIFRQHVEKQTGRKIKAIRSDNGREFVNNEFDSFLEKEGIARQLTVPYTPQQNGIAERANRTLVEMARSMMIYSGVHQYLWAEALNTSAYLRNRCPTRILGDKTPYEVWFGRKPNVQHLRTFGSYAVALNKAGTSKFEAKGQSFIMVGYSQVAKAYRLFDEDNRKIVERRDVLFEEDVNMKTDEQCSEIPRSCMNIDIEDCRPPHLIDNVESTSVGINPDGVTGGDSDEGDDFAGFETADEEENNTKVVKAARRGRPPKRNTLNSMVEEGVPNTVGEAINGPNSNKWYEAMRMEMQSLDKNSTWSLVDLPPGAKAINSKWVFAIKKNEHGEIERYKARLVAKGCSQRFGVDYTETFSPVVRYSTLRLVLALAVQWKMHLHQIDVSSAYLNSEIHHEIYMRQPEKFIDHRYPDRVLKLHKAIYGLKQSGKEWNDKLDSVLKRIGFEQSKNEPCLYMASFDGQLVIVAVYVDDLVIGCKEEAQVLRVKEFLAKNFPVTDKGPLHHYLGIEIEREGDTGAISMCQSQYIKDLLREYGMENCKPIATPLEANHQVSCSKDECELIDQHDYQSIIGALMYLAITTRPDILHSVSKLSQRNSEPHIEHMQAAKRILRYLRGTTDMKISYQAGENSMNGYVDADWGGNALDRKSFTGFIFYVGGCPVSWESRKQSCVALSSTEAEYMAMSDAAKEAIFLRRLLMEIGYSSGESFILNIDNQSAEKLATNPVYHKRTKHIDIRFHHVREVIRNNEMVLRYCPTENMIADILTKNLSKTKHLYFMKLMKFI